MLTVSHTQAEIADWTNGALSRKTPLDERPWAIAARHDGKVIVGAGKGVALFNPDTCKVEKEKDFDRKDSSGYGVFGMKVLHDGRLACVDYFCRCIWFWTPDFDDSVPVRRLCITFRPHDLVQLSSHSLALSLPGHVVTLSLPPFGDGNGCEHGDATELTHFTCTGPLGLSLAPRSRVFQQARFVPK